MVYLFGIKLLLASVAVKAQRPRIPRSTLDCEEEGGYLVSTVHGDICLDVDECDVGLQPGNSPACPENSRCDNTIGSYTCTCLPGYYWYNGECADIVNVNPAYPVDECSECDTERSDCVNNDGLYTCKCKESYLTHASGPTKCITIGECRNIEGYYPNPNNHKECINIDECADSMDDWYCLKASGAICIDTEGSFECSCPSTLQGTGLGAGLGDPCVCGDQKCHPDNADCVQTGGSYECVCKTGFEMDSSSGDVIDSYATNFPIKYKSNKQCIDIDECQKARDDGVAICPENTKCMNSVGSYWCGCPQGDETNLDNMQECPPNADCVSETSDGSYTCKCKEGYGRSTRDHTKPTICISMDECNKNCPPNASCNNYDGVYLCSCHLGYKLNPNQVNHDSMVIIHDDQECININECDNSYEDGYCVKSSGAICTDNEGSFECSCPSPLQGTGLGYLMRDGPEWSEDRCLCGDQECPHNSHCVEDGSNVYCRCRNGYKMEDQQCVNINECDYISLDDDGAHLCEISSGAICTNTEGSYECSCPSPLQGTGFYGDPCSCGEGYWRLGDNCRDLDECFTENECSDESECVNTDGSYICVCPDGYFSKDNECFDIDECDNDALNFCLEKSYCENTDGSYTCTCHQGFEQRGDSAIECVNIVECDLIQPGIPNNYCETDSGAICVDTIGWYMCACPNDMHGTGYFGDPCVKEVVRT